MRSTLACQWCRKSKTKCHHDGSAPCRSCTINERTDCVLSKPKSRAKRRILQSAEAPNAQNQNIPTRLASQGRQTPVSEVDRTLVMTAAQIFVRQFTMFSFLHEPTLFDSIREADELDLKFCGILALCARYIPELVDKHGGPTAASEYFASYLRRNISCQDIATAHLDTVQALLLLSFHDWGCCKGSQAWTYNGMAVRICHGINVDLSENTSPIYGEEVRRTLWACLLIENMLACGKNRPLSFRLDTYHLPLPLSDERFAFGAHQDSAPVLFLGNLDFENSSSSALKVTVQDSSEPSFSLIIQGFNIWSAVSTWLSSGGRKNSSPASGEDPWRPTSVWKRSCVALEDWRAAQSSQMKYSSSNFNLQAYILRNQGERFAFLNLIYYITTLFLHRQFLPFIPHAKSPLELPRTTEPAPPGWWETSVDHFFQTAADIIHLMKSLQHCGIDIRAPFTCFCVFNAATGLAYAKTWPAMASSINGAGVSEMYEWACNWLCQASELWEIARGWYSTLIEIDGIYSRFRTGASTQQQQLTDAGYRHFVRIQDQVERLAEPDRSKSPDIPHECGIEDREEEYASETPVSGQSQLALQTDSDQAWTGSSDLPFDLDFLSGVLSDPSGYLMQL